MIQKLDKNHKLQRSLMYFTVLKPLITKLQKFTGVQKIGEFLKCSESLFGFDDLRLRGVGRTRIGHNISQLKNANSIFSSKSYF
jgi:hypothetical protein